MFPVHKSHHSRLLLVSLLFLTHATAQTTPISIPSWSTATATSSSSTDPGNSIYSGPYSSYYYGFIALVLVAVIAGFWGIHSRRRRRKLRSTTGRQTALLQDAAGWPNNRRWIHGAWRGGEDGTTLAGEVEGFNERGEAPPPYKRAESVRETEHGSVEYSPTRESGDAVIAVPVQALARDGMGYKPPDYEDTIRRVGDEDTNYDRD